MDLQQQLDAALAALRLGEQMREWREKFFRDSTNKAALRAAQDLERRFDIAVKSILHPNEQPDLFGDPPVPDRGRAGKSEKSPPGTGGEP